MFDKGDSKDSSRSPIHLLCQVASAITIMYVTCCGLKVPSGYNKSGKVEMSLITGKHVGQIIFRTEYGRTKG